jgi:pyruvate formate lyase activating enzyme
LRKPETLQQALDNRTAVGELVIRPGDGRLQCVACGHRCVLKEGQRGICKVRFHEGGFLRVPKGYTSGVQADPIEKKPFFHVLPGTKALSFGMLGCDYHCDYCQNWITSQALRDPASEESGVAPQDTTAEALVRLARTHNCRTVTSTYNEPLITAEWAVEIFRLARQHKLLTSFVSNGNATPEALDYLKPHLDMYKVDLKSFNDATYRKTLGGPLKPVLDTLEGLKARGVWVEVVTLVVPGLNDSMEELKDIAKFLAALSRDIPWHVTAFHPDYKMEDRPWTEVERLNVAWQIGKEAGLKFVYSGNRPGEVGGTENTFCPRCNALLVERMGFHVLKNVLVEGRCPSCHTLIPGIWATSEANHNKVT